MTNEFLWLSVGRLDPVKNHATLLQAFAHLSAKGPISDCRGWSLKEQLSSLVQDLGLSDRVQLPGFQTDVLPWMRAADGFVLSFRWEGLPIALLEAGACRLPAVITDIPGAREVLPDFAARSSGSRGDAGALAAAMEAMMCLPGHDRATSVGATTQSVLWIGSVWKQC